MEPLVVALVALVGLVIGSFLNVVIVRLPLADPAERSLNGRSRCSRCGTPIAWYDNVPVLSWLVLRGRCRSCRERISMRYPLVEILTAALFAAVAAASDSWSTVVPGLMFMALLVPVVFIDIDVRRIPNVITYPGTLLGLAASIGFGPEPRFVSNEHWWVEVLVATVAGSGFLLVAALAYPGGMGMGDVKLAAMMGAFLGAPVSVALFGGFVIALIPSIALIVMHGSKARKMAIPFGPFLVAGAIGGWFWGAAILDWYLDVGV